MRLEEIIQKLHARESAAQAIYKEADSIRKDVMGDEVFLRGIIEFSNCCTKDCNYCGIQRSNKHVERYRIPLEEIVATCKKMKAAGQTTVVLQSGEDQFYTRESFGDILTAIKRETDLAITVSVGERDKPTYAYWKQKGMDRYLLRFETSNRELFEKCHPDDDLDVRIECLKNLKDLGVQTGSGFLIGLPGETYEDLARDILFCTELDLDMIGCGPFIAHPDTPFAEQNNPFDPEVYFLTIALLRILNPKAHIPSTTAFDAIDPNGRNLLLERGCNVFMPNATPKRYRDKYQLYPGKPCVDESGEECAECVNLRLKALGRTIGTGPGHSIK